LSKLDVARRLLERDTCYVSLWDAASTKALHNVIGDGEGDEINEAKES
jgi:hypothetical protein